MNTRRRLSQNLTAVQRPDLVEKVRRGEMDPAEATQIARNDVLRKMPADFGASIADLAKVPKTPPRRRQWFEGQLLSVIYDAWEQQENLDGLTSLTKDRAYANSINSLKAAKQALAQLSDVDRELLLFPITEIERGIDKFLEALGSTSPKVRMRGRGRPKGMVKNQLLHTFVWDSWKLPQPQGEPSVSRKTLAAGP